jgi:hypothetical protein
LLAQNRHADAVAACLLLGDERTWPGCGSKSENGPTTDILPILVVTSEAGC